MEIEISFHGKIMFVRVFFTPAEPIRARMGFLLYFYKPEILRCVQYFILLISRLGLSLDSLEWILEDFSLIPTFYTLSQYISANLKHYQ
jgi:hypothetical protein